MANFFETIGRTEASPEPTFQPCCRITVTSVRIAEAGTRGAIRAQKVKESLNYLLVRERVRVLTAPGDQDIEKYYEARLQKNSGDIGTRYGEALALMVDNRPVEAQKILDKLVEQHDGLTLLHAALGQAQIKAARRTTVLPH